jgi:hypothetical protein
MVRAKRAFAGVSPAVLIGATAAFVAVVPPAAAQDLGNPLGFLRELREIPLPGPNLLPGLQAPGNPAVPDNAGQTNSPDGPADPALDGALRPGSSPAVDAGTAAGEPAGNAPAAAVDGVPGSAPSEQVAKPADPIIDGGQPGGAPVAPEPAAASANPAVQPADPAVASPGSSGPQDSGPGPSESISSHALRPLRLGVLAGRDVQATMAALDPVTEGLTQAMGRSVEVLPMASYRAMIDAQQSQRVDGGFYSAEAYARAQAQCRCLEPLVAPKAGDGTAAYYAIIVAAPESGIATRGRSCRKGRGNGSGGLCRGAADAAYGARKRGF